ncbi:hypothetical protein ACLOJK_018239 [Asimina triloba]
MVNPKRLAAMARKCQKLASIGRRRITRTDVEAAGKQSTPSMEHFTIYNTDGRRFAVPLAYHNSPIFQELFRMSEDEFGLPRNGPIMLPCDAVFMDYIVSLLQKTVPEDLERALLLYSATSRCSRSLCLHQPHTNLAILVHGYGKRP